MVSINLCHSIFIQISVIISKCKFYKYEKCHTIKDGPQILYTYHPYIKNQQVTQ